MKKQFRCILSFVLVITLMLSVCVPAFATSSKEETIGTLNGSNATIRLTEEFTNTETIIRQYDNGNLSTVVHIPETEQRSNTTVLTVETLNSRGKVTDTEYIAVDRVQPQRKATERATPIVLGTLKYSTTEGQKTINVSFTTQYYYESAIVLPTGASTIATLTSIVISALGMKAIIANQVINWILGAMGIAITTGSFYFPGRVLSCDQNDYTYYLKNGSLPSHTNQFVSHEYYITDDRSENATFRGLTKMDGWNPSTARSQTVPFAQMCYSHMFEGSYSVIGWV